MATLVHILSAHQFDPKRGYFTSLAFKPDENGNVSSVSEDCIKGKGEDACDFLRQYYPDIFEELLIFLRFESEQLPAGLHIQHTPSGLDLDCHRDVGPYPEAEAREFVHNIPLYDGRVRICTPGGERALYRGDLPAWQPAA